MVQLYLPRAFKVAFTPKEQETRFFIESIVSNTFKIKCP